MNKEIRNKLHSQYIQGQRRKLESDPYYISLRDELVTILTYTVPVVTITNGFVSQEVPDTYDLVQATLDDYVNTMYPCLSSKSVGLIAYVKNHGLEPWYTARIAEPTTLPLDMIDLRLRLLNEYLRYRTHNYRETVWFLRYCEAKSLLWYWPSETVLEFDEWLYLENYDNLITIVWNQY